jgi:hypothetical protein
MKKTWLVIVCSAFVAFSLVTGCAQSPVRAGDASATPVQTSSADPEMPPAASNEASVGMVRGKILLDNGEMVPAGIIVENANGDRFRTTTNALAGYNLRLAPGEYTLYFTKGPEYSVVSKTVTVESFKVLYMQDVRLVQLFDAYALGWIAGDLHQHTFYSDGADSVDEQLLSNLSNGLYYGFLSDHNSARGLAEWVQGNHAIANTDAQGTVRFFNPYEAVEVTTEFGHYQSLGIGLTFDTYEVQLYDIERSKTGAEKDEIIKQRIIYIAESIRRAGGVPQINHPYSSNTMGFNYWEIADYFDTVEIWNGVFVPGDGRYEPEKESEQSQNYSSKLKWFELLNGVKNGGKFLAATGGTDNHDSTSTYIASGDIAEILDKDTYEAAYVRNGRYSGVPTTYVYCPDAITQQGVLDALQAGHSFITNGIILIGTIGDAIYGDTVPLGAAAPVLNLNAFCRDGIESIRIIKNGETFMELPLSGTTQYQDAIPLEGLAPGDWIVIEGLGSGTLYAITNPFFFS